MTLTKDDVMRGMQRFGGSMLTPVILFSFFGIAVSFSIIFKNPDIVGAMATKGTWWYNFWYVVEQGGWTVFSQMPLLFAMALPIGLASKNQARCCMEAFVVYLVFNYFISGCLTLDANYFGVDYSKEPGSGTGLAMVAGIKTLDLGMLGGIGIAAITVWLHNRLFDVDLPDWMGVFKGSTLVTAAGFALMIPLAFLACLVWPPVQHFIANFQDFLVASGGVGVWIYTFLERILIPTGLHHFIWTPFELGPAVVDGGIKAYWLTHLKDFADSSIALKDAFPGAGFNMQGLSKIFGMPGIALAFYFTAKTKKRKAVAGLVIPAAVTAVLCGITEPLEFTFLFVAPVLFVVHALLAGCLAATEYAFGVVGAFGGGLLDALTQNWIPLFAYHSSTYITQIAVGLFYTAVYFVVFRYLILKFDFKTPGRTDEAEDKLYTKADYRAKQAGVKIDARDEKARAFLEGLGGAANIEAVTNCSTRLRVNVKDEDKVAPAAFFTQAGAHGLVKKGTAVQVIVGLSVPQVRERFEALLNTPDSAADVTAVGTAYSAALMAPVSGRLMDIAEVPDEMFSSKMMGDGIAIEPTEGEVKAPADAEVTMVMADSLHALGLKLANGVEVLIHIGIDTVNMNGEGFKLLVNVGDKVKEGDILVRFDRELIKQAGYSDIVIMSVTNSAEFPQMQKAEDMEVEVDAVPVLTF